MDKLFRSFNNEFQGTLFSEEAWHDVCQNTFWDWNKLNNLLQNGTTFMDHLDQHDIIVKALWYDLDDTASEVPYVKNYPAAEFSDPGVPNPLSSWPNQLQVFPL